MSIRNVVLIAGVHGASGRAAAEHWISIPGTRVYGLSRRVASLPPGVEAVNAERRRIHDYNLAINTRV